VNNSAKEIKEVCLRILSGREHSKQELLQKLAAKGYGHNDALAVIDELAREGWQNDLRYAESHARSRILKGYGPVRIVYELRQNGIDTAFNEGYGIRPPRADFDLEGLVQATAGSWMALLERVYTKKYGGGRQLEANERAKRSRFLIQRGFTGTMISELFKHLNIL
jgi:regulatory protein